VVIPVELFTEKTIIVPVNGLNIPDNIDLVTFPNSIKISFFVGMSRYDKITAENFKAFIDYKSIINDKNGKQKIQLSYSVPFIKNVSFEPTSVEYILEKK
jgi:hypothetical protein